MRCILDKYYPDCVTVWKFSWRPFPSWRRTNVLLTSEFVATFKQRGLYIQKTFTWVFFLRPFNVARRLTACVIWYRVYFYTLSMVCKRCNPFGSGDPFVSILLTHSEAVDSDRSWFTFLLCLNVDVKILVRILSTLSQRKNANIFARNCDPVRQYRKKLIA